MSQEAPVPASSLLYTKTHDGKSATQMREETLAIRESVVLQREQEVLKREEASLSLQASLHALQASLYQRAQQLEAARGIMIQQASQMGLFPSKDE